jgi:hypothetical protein
MQELSTQSDEMKIEVNLLQEESVSHEIKKELIEPIENMENKLELKYRLTGALSNVRPMERPNN